MNFAMRLLAALVGLSAVLTIWGEETNRRRLVFIFKPSTTSLIFFTALIVGWKHPTAYTIAIWVGLLFSLAGDIFLMLPGDQFIQGLLSFLMAHLFYIFAFTRGHPFCLDPALIVFLFYGILVFAILYPSLGNFKKPVAVYVLVILVMAWQAWQLFASVQNPSTTRAFLGALLFVISDSLLATNRFRKKLPLAQLWILGTYFSAQWLFALSVQ